MQPIAVSQKIAFKLVVKENNSNNINNNNSNSSNMEYLTAQTSSESKDVEPISYLQRLARGENNNPNPYSNDQSTPQLLSPSRVFPKAQHYQQLPSFPLPSFNSQQIASSVPRPQSPTFPQLQQTTISRSQSPPTLQLPLPQSPPPFPQLQQSTIHRPQSPTFPQLQQSTISRPQSPPTLPSLQQSAFPQLTYLKQQPSSTPAQHQLLIPQLLQPPTPLTQHQLQQQSSPAQHKQPSISQLLQSSTPQQHQNITFPSHHQSSLQQQSSIPQQQLFSSQQSSIPQQISISSQQSSIPPMQLSFPSLDCRKLPRFVIPVTTKATPPTKSSTILKPESFLYHPMQTTSSAITKKPSLVRLRINNNKNNNINNNRKIVPLEEGSDNNSLNAKINLKQVPQIQRPKADSRAALVYVF